MVLWQPAGRPGIFLLIVCHFYILNSLVDIMSLLIENVIKTNGIHFECMPARDPDRFGFIVRAWKKEYPGNSHSGMGSSIHSALIDALLHMGVLDVTAPERG
jgi:hypothetical protein